MNDFEFDGDKSKANLEKHGIDFQTAQELWKILSFWSSRSNPTTSLDFLSLAVSLKSTGLPSSLTETREFA